MKKANRYTARRTPADEGAAAARQENDDQARRTLAATLEKWSPTLGLKRLASGEEVVDGVGDSILRTIHLQAFGQRRAAAILSGLVHFGMRAPNVRSSGAELLRMILRLNAAASKR